MKPMKPQNKKRGSAFFEHFLKQSGPDFLMKENVLNLKRKANMFFRDMANGAFEFDKHGQYLADDRLIQIMIQEATHKQIIHSIHYNAVNLMIVNDPASSNNWTQHVARMDYDSASAYTLILETLQAFYNTRNLSLFEELANRIRPIKHSL